MTLRLLALAGLAALQTASADLVVVEDVHQTGPAPAEMQTTLKISGDHVRVDIGKDVSTLVDTKTNSAVSLIHKQKLAMKLPQAAMDAIKAKTQDQTNSEKPSLKPTGKKEEINGFQCEEYSGTYQGMQVSYWVTQDIKNADEIMGQLEKLSGKADPFKNALANGEKLPGVPIRTVVQSPNGKTVVTIHSIDEKDIPASEFEVPSGYKVMTMPQAPPAKGMIQQPTPAPGAN